MEETSKSIEESSRKNIIDSTSNYPTVISVLNNIGDGNTWITYKKNIDNIQEELEFLFVSLNKQHSELSDELSSQDFLNQSSLANVESIKDESNAGDSNVQASENKTPEKVSDNNKRLYSARVRGKPAKTQDLEFSLKSDIPKQQKNDTPNRFWAFVDPYCCDIAKDDIKMLENWIDIHKQDPEYQDIPPLGKHYSATWTEIDMLEEIREGSKSVENPKGADFCSLENTSGAELLNRAKEESMCHLDESPPLIQNLISSLVQENIIASSDIMAETISEIDIQDHMTNESETPSAVFEDNFENNLIADLVKSGVLEKTWIKKDDELLQELQQMQKLLIPVSNLNLLKKKELLARAKSEMSKQESKKRIQEADAKVMESYRAMSAARSKGKKMSKNELYVIRTILEEREALIKNVKTDG